MPHCTTDVCLHNISFIILATFVSPTVYKKPIHIYLTFQPILKYIMFKMGKADTMMMLYIYALLMLVTARYSYYYCIKNTHNNWLLCLIYTRDDIFESPQHANEQGGCNIYWRFTTWLLIEFTASKIAHDNSFAGAYNIVAESIVSALKGSTGEDNTKLLRIY